MPGPYPGTVAGTAAAVRTGERSASDNVEAALVSAVAHSALNAFTILHDEPARAAAAAVDRAVANGDDPGPLAGVPVAVKDLVDEAGIPNTRGSRFPPDVPESDAPVVSRLRAAGAVIIGRTGLHEFAFGFSSENEHFGPVRNPWDPTTSPGGSSGGSGAAVGAGIVPAAIGTDTGGSVRVPAALCGAVGLKVSHGRVSTTGVYPLAPSIDTVGPIAATVADAAAIYGVIAGFDVSDPWSRDRPVLPPRMTAPGDVRLGIPHPWVDRPMSVEVAAAWDWFLSAARGAGIELVDLELPELVYPGKMPESVYPEVAAIHRERYEAEPERYGREVGERIASTLGYTMHDYLRGLAWRARIRDAADAGLAQCDALVTPTVAAMRKEIGVDTVEIDGAPVGYRVALSCFTAIVNHAGLPALAVPLASAGAPPPSVQLIGPMWGESGLLGVGLALESAGIASSPAPAAASPRRA